MYLPLTRALSQPTDAFQRRHVATLLAAGWSDDDIAAAAKIELRVLRVLRVSEIFQAIVAQVRRELHVATATSAKERLRALHSDAIDVLSAYVKDTRTTKRAHNLRAAIEINRSILPRPGRTSTGVPQGVLPPEERARLLRALPSVTIELEDQTAATIAPPAGIRTIDEAVAEVESA